MGGVGESGFLPDEFCSAPHAGIMSAWPKRHSLPARPAELDLAARAAAQDGYDLILTSRSLSDLESVASELRSSFGVNVDCIAADLSTVQGCRAVIDAVYGRDMDALVNNAGRGVYGSFSDSDGDDILNMMALNMRAPVMLTKALLPQLIVRKGRILNVASIAGFMPGPYFGSYHATKAFVRIWSESLAEELTDVSVTTYCPGPTHTGFEVAAHAERSGIFRGVGVPSGDEVGAAAWHASMQGRRVVVHGLKNKLTVCAMRFLPRTWQAKAVKQVTRKR